MRGHIHTSCTHTWFPDFQVCTAMPFFLSHFFTAALCWTPSGVGVCQSEGSCTKPLPQKDGGSSTYPPDTNHDKPGLRLNLRQYLVPPPHMTLPIKSFSHPVLRITPFPPPFQVNHPVSCLTLYHHYIILIFMSPCPPFPTCSCPVKSRSFLKFCTTDEDLQIETSCIE